ncbi:mitogen-activated protein kinase kinase kinase 7 isoform X2 [Prorops nasuta]
MEYAEGGSLYNILHNNPRVHYTAGHAMSWALQCARGVAYLHSMKPKPLIHRDLKPPNLLLVMGGQMLKICDFGTACDLNTYMTNNKGSAAWMAPEVFEGSKYTEKCDVFSWGVILWEVLSRKKPFDDIGGSTYRIMWAVHIGQRPPLIEDCPKPIEELMIRCWHKIPEERPSMDEVVRIMTELSEFFSGHMEPVEYSLSNDWEEQQDDKNDTLDMASTLNSRLNGSIVNGTILAHKANNSIEDMDSISLLPQTVQGQESNNKVDKNQNSQSYKAVSKPASSYSPHYPELASNSNLTMKKILPQMNLSPLHVECEPNAWDFGSSSDSSWEIQKMAGLDKMVHKKKPPQSSSTTNEDLDNVYRLLDAELRPLTPDQTCERSREIFEEHKQLAQEYLKVQTEIALLGQHKNEMLKNLSLDTLKQQQELRKLEDEKESLVKLYRNLQRQLEIMKSRRSNNALVNPSGPTIGTAISENNGWVVMPRQQDPSRLS